MTDDAEFSFRCREIGEEEILELLERLEKRFSRQISYTSEFGHFKTYL